MAIKQFVFASTDAEPGDRVKVLDEFYYGLEGKLVKLGGKGQEDTIKLNNGKTIQTNLWYNMEE
jgi:hypothetical protein